MYNKMPIKMNGNGPELVRPFFISTIRYITEGHAAIESYKNALDVSVPTGLRPIGSIKAPAIRRSTVSGAFTGRPSLYIQSVTLLRATPR